MKPIVGLVLAILVIVGVAPYARSLGTPSSPPGVAAQDWVPFGDAGGFVVVHDKSSVATAPAADTVRGYFLVRRHGAWLRVDAAPNYGVQKTLM
jgi:hypothetical protein